MFGIDELKKCFSYLKQDIVGIIQNLPFVITEKVNSKKYALLKSATDIILEYVISKLKDMYQSDLKQQTLIQYFWDLNLYSIANVIRNKMLEILGDKEMDFSDLIISFVNEVNKDDVFIKNLYDNIDMETSIEKQVLVTWAMVNKSLNSQISTMSALKTYLNSLLKRILPIEYMQKLLDNILYLYRQYIHGQEVNNQLEVKYESYINSLKKISNNMPVLAQKVEELRNTMDNNRATVAEIMMSLSNHAKQINGLSRFYTLPTQENPSGSSLPLTLYNYYRIKLNSEELMEILKEYTMDYEKANEILLTIFGSAKLEKSMGINVRELGEYDFSPIINIENKIEELIEQSGTKDVSEKIEDVLREFDKGGSLKDLIFKKVAADNMLEYKIRECIGYYENCINKMKHFGIVCKNVANNVKGMEQLLYKLSNNEEEIGQEESSYGLSYPSFSFASLKEKINKYSAKIFSFKTNYYEISNKLYLELKNYFNIFYQNLYRSGLFYDAMEFEKNIKNKISDYFQGSFRVFLKNLFVAFKNDFEESFENLKNNILEKSIPGYQIINMQLKSLKDAATSEFEKAMIKIAESSGKYVYGPVQILERKKIKIESKEFFELFIEQMESRKEEIIDTLNKIFSDKAKEIFDRLFEKASYSVEFTTYISLNAFKTYKEFVDYLYGLVGICNKFIKSIKESIKKYQNNEKIVVDSDVINFGIYLNNIGIIDVNPSLLKDNDEDLSSYINRMNILESRVKEFKDKVLEFIKFLHSLNFNQIYSFQNIDESYNLSTIDGVAVTIKDKLQERFDKILSENSIIKKIYNDLKSGIADKLNLENNIQKEVNSILLGNKAIEENVIPEEYVYNKQLHINEKNIALGIVMNFIYKIVSSVIYKNELKSFFYSGNFNLDDEDIRNIQRVIYTDPDIEYIRNAYQINHIPKKEEVIKILNDIRKFAISNNLIKLIGHMTGEVYDIDLNKKASENLTFIEESLRELVKEAQKVIANFIFTCYENALNEYQKVSKDVYMQDEIENKDYGIKDLSLSMASDLKNNVLKKIAYLTPNYEWYKEYDLSSNRLNILNLNKEKFVIVSKEKFEPGEQVIIDNGEFQKEAIIAENIDNYKYKVYIDGLEDVVSVMNIKKIRRQKNG